ncbi:MAG TPA: VWA domain-containing protein [Acidobacteriota bacterium]|nr:VWA domain-containing protein [Acidobacteriota bacterium]
MGIYSQDSEEPSKRDPSKRVKPELEPGSHRESSEPKGFKIGVTVDLVLMYTTVFDKTGHFVSGLKQEDFRLYEDGVQQNIQSFSQEDVPVSMGILLDLSGSMRGKIEQVNKAALAFIQASNPRDQVFLIGFNEEVELLQDFTSDIDEITDALENIVVMGSTALYDAVYLGVQKAHTGTKPKKAVVLITDGVDRESYYTLEQMISKVQESDVQVFVVGLLDPIKPKGFFSTWSKSVPEKARDALIKIAEETGGKAFFPNQTGEIHGIVAEIASELRNQYSLGYTSSNAVRDGSFRKVKIEFVGANAANNKLRYRRGYFAPKTDAAQKSDLSPVGTGPVAGALAVVPSGSHSR